MIASQRYGKGLHARLARFVFLMTNLENCFKVSYEHIGTLQRTTFHYTAVLTSFCPSMCYCVSDCNAGECFGGHESLIKSDFILLESSIKHFAQFLGGVLGDS